MGKTPEDHKKDMDYLTALYEEDLTGEDYKTLEYLVAESKKDRSKDAAMRKRSEDIEKSAKNLVAADIQDNIGVNAWQVPEK